MLEYKQWEYSQNKNSQYIYYFLQQYKLDNNHDVTLPCFIVLWLKYCGRVLLFQSTCFQSTALIKVDLSCKTKQYYVEVLPSDALPYWSFLIMLDFRCLVTTYKMSLWALTSVGEMNQGSEGLWIDSLHLDLLLLCLSHVVGEHSSKVVRHGAQDQSAIKKTKGINA